jgi:hypothetical protein
MTDLKTNLVRENVRHIFAEYCAEPSPDLDSIRESILIRDGYFCGWRFCGAGLQAVWFVEENELKVFSVDGALLLVTAADSTWETSVRRAA